MTIFTALEDEDIALLVEILKRVEQLKAIRIDSVFMQFIISDSHLQAPA